MSALAEKKTVHETKGVGENKEYKQSAKHILNIIRT